MMASMSTTVPTVTTASRPGRNAVNRCVVLHREGGREVQVTRFIDPNEAEYIATQLRGALADAFHAGVITVAS